MASTNPASSSSLGINASDSGNININKTNWFMWIVLGLGVLFGGIWLVKRKKK